MATPIPREEMERLVFDGPYRERFTQDSPIMPDVWLAYAKEPGTRIDLLLEPHARSTAAELARELHLRVADDENRRVRLAYDESRVAAALTLDELLRFALPLTNWGAEVSSVVMGKEKARSRRDKHADKDAVEWLRQLVAHLVLAERPGQRKKWRRPDKDDLAAFTLPEISEGPLLLWSVNRNRGASIAINDSRRTIKVDAAQQVFSVATDGLAWAIFDTGIDARHPAFVNRGGTATGAFPATRVRATYDFTKLRHLLDGSAVSPEERAELRRRLQQGRAIDWATWEPLLQVPHDASYLPPGHPHGTHVAGILGACWPADDATYTGPSESGLTGMCPTIRLYDFRVLDKEGKGDEFGILGALQFLRFLNHRSPHQLVHGANLSLFHTTCATTRADVPRSAKRWNACRRRACSSWRPQAITATSTR